MLWCCFRLSFKYLKKAKEDILFNDLFSACTFFPVEGQCLKVLENEHKDVIVVGSVCTPCFSTCQLLSFCFDYHHQNVETTSSTVGQGRTAVFSIN